MIGLKLKYLRKKSKMKQSELALKLGVSRSQISHYEQNVGFPSYDVLNKICDVFSVPLDYFRDGQTVVNLVHALELTDDDFKNRALLFLQGQPLTDDEFEKMIEFVKYIRFSKGD